MRLEYKFPLEVFLRHETYEIKVHNKKYFISISEPKDSLRLEITTWRGVSIGAVHYYGTLGLPRLNFVDFKTRYYCSGSNFPRVFEKIELYRELTEEEIGLNEDKYIGYNPGDMIPGFNTKEEVITKARNVVRRHFPRFRMIVED